MLHQDPKRRHQLVTLRPEAPRVNVEGFVDARAHLIDLSGETYPAESGPELRWVRFAFSAMLVRPMRVNVAIMSDRHRA